jgi:hypothetical protein
MNQPGGPQRNSRARHRAASHKQPHPAPNSIRNLSRPSLHPPGTESHARAVGTQHPVVSGTHPRRDSDSAVAGCRSARATHSSIDQTRFSEGFAPRLAGPSFTGRSAAAACFSQADSSSFLGEDSSERKLLLTSTDCKLPNRSASRTGIRRSWAVAARNQAPGQLDTVRRSRTESDGVRRSQTHVRQLSDVCQTSEFCLKIQTESDKI